VSGEILALCLARREAIALQLRMDACKDDIDTRCYVLHVRASAPSPLEASIDLVNPRGFLWGSGAFHHSIKLHDYIVSTSHVFCLDLISRGNDVLCADRHTSGNLFFFESLSYSTQSSFNN
jgi:hypothetical protein